jgi:hypothetical protein
MLQLLYWGGPTPDEGTGFDDYLRFVGEDGIADDLDALIPAAIETCRGMSETLHESLVGDGVAAAELFAAVKAVTDILKVDFVVALSLEVPSEGAGDAD